MDGGRGGGVRRTELLRRVVRAAELRRLLLGFSAFSFAENATWLAMLVFAFERGGVSEAGVVAVIQLVPAVLVAPFAAFAGDRFRPDRALAWGYAAQGIAMGTTAVAMFAGAPLAVYAGGTAVAACVTFTRPVMGALLPRITHTPRDLIAANVVMGAVEHLGVFLGPMIAGLVLVVASPGAVFAGSAVVVLLGSVLAFVVARGARAEVDASIDAGGVLEEVFGGIGVIRRHSQVRVLLGMTTIVGVAAGGMDVLAVTFASERLSGGGGGAGLLSGGLGFGALMGSALAAGLVGRAQVAPYFVRAAILLSLPLLVLAATSHQLVALASFVLVGAGDSLLKIAASVAVQRRAPTDVLARIFGVIEGLQMAAMATGALLTSLAVPAFGLTSALVALALVLVGFIAYGTARLRHLGGDRPPPPAELFERLLRDPVLAPLPAPALERMAETVETLIVPPGTDVVLEGALGDRYYLIVSGVLSVTMGGQFVEELDATRTFGEVALLHDVPRLATVTARSDVELLAVSRTEFLTAVTGHPQSRGVATDIAQRFLDGRPVIDQP